MKPNSTSSFFNQPIEGILKISVLSIIVIWSYLILKPFLVLLVWSLIIAVALKPKHEALSKKLGGHSLLSSAVITFLLIIVITLPISILVKEVIRNFINLTELLNKQNIDLPPPSERIKEIALIGEYVWTYWNEISDNLEKFLSNHASELEKIGFFLFGSVAVAGKGLFLFITAVVVSGVFLVYAKSGRKFAENLSEKLAGKRGHNLVKLVETTIRSVVAGVLGIAIIQTFLVGVGLFFAEIPYWGLLTLLILFLALIQVGATPVLIGVLVYLFMNGENSIAAIFIVWNVIVIIIDSILKPILLGRGVKVPMVIIFLGSLGGFIHTGFLGLFLGPVVLALAYELLTAWVNNRELKPETFEKIE